MDAALSLGVPPDASSPDAGSVASFFERVDEEIPAKWARKMRRLCQETGVTAVVLA